MKIKNIPLLQNSTKVWDKFLNKNINSYSKKTLLFLTKMQKIIYYSKNYIIDLHNINKDLQIMHLKAIRNILISI